MSDKKYYILILTVVMAMLFSPACKKDFLNPQNPSSLTDKDIFGNASMLRLYVNNIYNDRPGWDYNVYNNISDEARCNFPGYSPNNILVGGWDATNNPMDIYADAYKSIRKMNEFFNNIKSSSIEPGVLKSMSAEVHFLRAFQYFDLVKRYGGVPLIKEVQSLNDDLFVQRSSIDETFGFILTDLDKAIADLPESAPGGRAGKGAALALKGRVLLYFASPLYNPSNKAERWADAAAASKAVIDLNKYTLYPDLNKLWLNSTNSESIFEIQYALPQKSAGIDGIARPLVIAVNDVGQLSPLQELVDAFPMSNGKLINENGSGYDPAFPYNGRDNRFAAYIAHNGSTMWGTNNGPPAYPITLEIYDGGRDYNGVELLGNTITGYFSNKALDPNNATYDGSYGGTQPFMELRYAEVLLNYAEAKNEASGPDQSVYDAVNIVRKRAGITTMVSGLGQTEIRALIRNERYVELCFEHHRYWDLRRWKLAVNVLNGTKKTGVFITKQSNNSFTYKYIPVDLQNLVFLEKMYFMPIPFSEISKNKNLSQNPGWER